MNTVKNLPGCRKIKRLICLFLAVVTLAPMLLPANVTMAHAAEKTVTVPDPADYFGAVSKTENEERYNAYTFDGYATFPKSKVESYYNALKKLGLTTSDQATEPIINFKYNGKSGVQISWSKSNADIRINVVKPLMIGKSTTTTTTTTTTTAGKKAAIPSPADYFGSISKTAEGNNATVYVSGNFSSYPQSKLESYIKALKAVGLTGGTVEKQSNGDMLAILKCNGERAISIRWYKKDQYVWFNISNIVTVGAEQKNDHSKPSILDMIEKHFGKNGNPKYNKDNYETVFQYKAVSNADTKLQSFVDELKRMGATTFVHSFSSSGGSKTFTIYWDVGSSLVDGKWTKKDNNVRITVDWEYIEKTGKFDEDDIPQKPAPAPAPQPGPDDREPCSWCGGDGKCRDCGGSGSVRKWVSGTVRSYVTQNCTSCYIPGKCRDCGGDGWK